MTPPELPIYAAASRRRFLSNAAVFGAVLAAPGMLAGCGTDDATALSGGTTTAASSTTSAAAAEATTTTAATSSSTAASSSGGDAIPASAKVDVAFTYAPSASGFGPAHSPFVAVWVEDSDGNFVNTVSVWYNPPKGERWINHLESWFSAADGTDVDAVTGATRPAGTYSVTWDGTDTEGNRVPSGDYVVYVEAAREHGPHSLSSGNIELGSAKTSVSFADSEELSAVAANYTV